ncbi:MAG: DUF177 domain-containing protein [Armatimonadota bacterium]
MMRLDLSEVAGNLGKTYHYDIREQCFENEDFRCISPITGAIDFTNTGRLIIVRGNFSTTVELDCSRCLEKLTLPVEVKVEEQLPIKNFLIEPVEDEDFEEEEEVSSFFENNIFDLSEYIRQAIVVQLPIKPLCSDACKGLCPTCGKNLNEGPCDCPVTIQESPFSALQGMLEEENEEE